MRNTSNKIFAFGLCALMLTTTASAADKQDLGPLEKISWLQLRTLFASSDRLSNADWLSSPVVGIKKKSIVFREKAPATSSAKISGTSTKDGQTVLSAKAINKKLGKRHDLASSVLGNPSGG